MPAIGSLVALMLLLNVSGLPVAAIPVKQAITPKRFVDWCLGRANLTSEIKHTVDVLLQEAKTKDCKQADNKLSTFIALYLADNQIADLKPLSSLTKLTFLGLVTLGTPR